MTTPLSTATPATAMNPTAAGIENGRPRRLSASTPPTSASGHAGEHRDRVAQVAEHQEQHREDDRRAPSAPRARAACWRARSSRTGRPTPACTPCGQRDRLRDRVAAPRCTKLTRSRPRTLTSTSTRRCSDSRLITAGPSRLADGRPPTPAGPAWPVDEPTSSSPNASGVERRRRQQQHQVEAARALEDLAGGAPDARRLDDLQHRPAPACRSAPAAARSGLTSSSGSPSTRCTRQSPRPGTSRTTLPISSAVALSTVRSLAEDLDRPRRRASPRAAG